MLQSSYSVNAETWTGVWHAYVSSFVSLVLDFGWCSRLSRVFMSKHLALALLDTLLLSLN